MPMRRKIPNLLAAALFSTAMLAATSPQAAVAGYGSVVRINGDGKRICDTFESRGEAYWAAKVRGRMEDDSGGFTDRFTVRTCFANLSQCKNFINRIHHHIFPIEQIYYSACKAEG